MQIEQDWLMIKKIFKQSFLSSFHYSIATVDENGKPHVTPIGSLILGKSGQGIYFEKFPCKLPNNLKENPAISVLAVNSGRGFWLKSLVRGRFSQPPAIRLQGEAGKLRAATNKEIELWHKRIKLMKFTAGYRIMWQDMKMVREIEFTKVETVKIGSMTENEKF